MGARPLTHGFRARRRATARAARRQRERRNAEGTDGVPTGVAIRDPRGQLFDAAERVLLRDGPGGLTSRAVTAEAGVAKGVLHRHFADFDAFLAGLALDRVARIGAQAATLGAAAGSATVAGNLAAALADLFTPAVLALIRLVIERDLGRLAADADISTLAPTLIGAAHLLFTDTDGAPEPAAVTRVVAAVLPA